VFVDKVRMSNLIHDYTDRLLRDVSKEFNISYDNLKTKYLFPPCIAMTSRGKNCTNKCIIGSKFCKKHEGYIPPVEKKKGRKATKQVKTKIIPIHTHDGHNGECELCRSHGDILDPNTPHRVFEITLTKEMIDFL